MHHRTNNRRGDAETTVIAIILILIIVGAGLLIGFGNYHNGYRKGQIDAANGKMQFTKVQQGDTTYWYKTDNPLKLYAE